MIDAELAAELGLSTNDAAEALGVIRALKADRVELASLKIELGLLHAERRVTLETKRKYDEAMFLETGKKRGAIALGFDEEEVRSVFRRSPDEARVMLSARPDFCRTPVGAPRDSAPPALRPEDLPANQGPKSIAEMTPAEQDTQLDGALGALGIGPERIRSMRENLKANGLSDADIRTQLLAMSKPVQR